MELDQILLLIKTVSNSRLSQFELKQGDLKISMSAEATVVTERPSAAPIVMEQAADIETPAEEKKGNIVKAPLVGTFYSSPSPDSEPFVKVGDTVQAGQVLGIVEAMKLMNEIESEFSGKVTEILVENEQAVEYGQPLFVIE